MASVGTRLAAISTLALLAACTARPSFTPGDECELNTNCATPLVCRLGRCRVECRAARDCGPTLECVRDERGLGACQLPHETECRLSSDCPPHLVCQFGRCTNECETDRDCPPGARCLTDDDGSRGCRDESTMECELTSDCMDARLICAPDRRCREPCRTDWDCSDDRECVTDELTIPFCRARLRTPPDSGSMDGASPDTGTDAGPDARVADGGTDAGVPPPPPPPRISAGLQNTCAALSDRDLHCWGANVEGQIGDGSTTLRPAPTLVDGGGRPALVGVGHGHACAPIAGRLHCWGKNGRGQLGLGDTEPVRQLLPIEVASLPAGTVVDVALGREHTCAIVDTRLFCWGANEWGQLGVGDALDRATPTEVTGLSDVPVQLAAFSAHTCVRGAVGAVDCFGDNAAGQLGTGDRTSSHVPRAVMGITDAVMVGAGAAHTCAVRRGGAVWCWGSDTLGQAGNGGRIGDPDLLVPTPTPLPAPALQVAAGSAHTCARTETTVYCWGDNFVGQCGRADTEPTIFSPAPVAGIDGPREVALGSEHTCARTDTTLFCFGGNAEGQLGIGSTSPSYDSTPRPVVWP